MSEPLFDIVFRGDLMPGHRLPEVKARLAQLFKIDAHKVDALFNGAVVTLKRNLDEPTANKYQRVLRGAGAAVELRTAGAAVAQRNRPAPEARLSLAPLGADLLSVRERTNVSPPALDLAGYSIKPLEGYLLDEAEKSSSDSAPQFNYDFDLAPAGADLLELQAEQPSVAEINPSFELAEPGENLLKPEEKPKQKAVQVSTDHITLV